MIILVAMVWIVILTVSLAELANYLWQKRRGARAAVASAAAAAIMDCSVIQSDGGRTADDTLDVPVQIVVVPRASEKYGILASESDSDSVSDGDMKEYHIL